MAQTAPKEETAEREAHDLAAEMRAVRHEFAEQDGHDIDQQCSPQAFYERSVRHPDIRELLKRLADR